MIHPLRTGVETQAMGGVETTKRETIGRTCERRPYMSASGYPGRRPQCILTVSVNPIPATSSVRPRFSRFWADRGLIADTYSWAVKRHDDTCREISFNNVFGVLLIAARSASAATAAINGHEHVRPSHESWHSGRTDLREAATISDQSSGTIQLIVCRDDTNASVECQEERAHIVH